MTTNVDWALTHEGLYMKVSDSELKLLDTLWNESPLTVGQLIERVQQNNDWHANTIKTLLTRITKKQAVTRVKDGGRFFYSANISRDDVLMQESDGFLSKFFGGKMVPFIAHFNKTKKISTEEIEELEAILAKMKQDND